MSKRTIDPEVFFAEVFAQYERIYQRWTDDDFKSINDYIRRAALDTPAPDPRHDVLMFACIGVDALRAIRLAREVMR